MRETVLWGQHVDEYQQMFGLSDSDIHSRLLEYGCGATAVNAQLHARGQSIISCDPLFTFDKLRLDQSVQSTFDEAVQHLNVAHEQYDFSYYGGLTSLIAKRRQGIDRCLADYEAGRMEKRYLPLEHDALPFEDFSFDLALCSHFLFVSIDEQDVDFHLRCIRELARVAKEVRIFPLIDESGQPSPALGPSLLGLQQENYGVEIRKVDYQLQRGGNAMLRVWALECQV